MNLQYQFNLEAKDEFRRIVQERCTFIFGTYFERAIAKELGISNSSVARLINGSLDDILMSTFLAFCKYLCFSEKEILYLFKLAIAKDEDIPKILQNGMRDVEEALVMQRKLKQIKEIIQE